MSAHPASLVAIAGAAVLGLSFAALAAPDVDAARRILAQVNARESALEARMGQTRSELARLLGALELYGRNPPPALLVSAGDARDAVRAMILIRAIMPGLEARASALAGEARVVQMARRRVAAASGELFAAESALADREGRLEGVAADAESLSPPEARGNLNVSRAPIPTTLVMPVAGAVITRFGARAADGSLSRGLWLSAPPGAAVASPAAGVIDYAGPLAGWGLILILRGPGGCHIVLSGLGKAVVARGATVGAGQIVGATAAPGAAPATLYFEFRVGGVPKDPARLMAKTGVAPTGLRRERL